MVDKSTNHGICYANMYRSTLGFPAGMTMEDHVQVSDDVSDEAPTV